MKIFLLLISFVTFLQCQPDSEPALTTPCQKNTVPVEWNCEERINYNFCFPPSYNSEQYFFQKSEPYASFSKGVFKDAKLIDIDINDHLEMPFPDQVILPQDNLLTEKIEICDDDEIIGVFYYGKVILDNMHDYLGCLYLKPDDVQQKYYLSAHSSMTKEGISEMLEIVRKIKRS